MVVKTKKIAKMVGDKKKKKKKGGGGGGGIAQ